MSALHSYRFLVITMILTVANLAAETLQQSFRDLPKSSKRHTGPLFWLHGDESPERLNAILDKVAEGGNGSFTAESRPHKDWLGDGWYRDLEICLNASKRLDLQMWIFDEDWWPSQTVAGKVPIEYAAKILVAEAKPVDASHIYLENPATNPHFIALVAGRIAGDGAIDAKSLQDLTQIARKGPMKWTPPEDGGKWQVMEFHWEPAPRLKQGKRLAIDGMSRDCVDWYIKTVYEPHHARFGGDFGKTIPGFFYDEPETPGDWGTELAETFKSMGADWMPAFVAWKFKLSGEAQAAAFYQYAEARAETWGRVTYGGLSEWCRKRGVVSIGHFMEHGNLYYNPAYCAGDLMRLQKYSDMGGIDLVCRQLYPGKRPVDIYQTPKLGSSVSHVYGKKDDLAMCEIFGGYDQKLTYPQMKWLCDQHQLRGINFMIPHSFNPRAPVDKDYPPYFYNGGFEPRFALYRVWADYSSRLSLMLTGGHHVCPVAVLFSGNAKQLGEYTTPEDLTTAVQDAIYDCDWLPFERFEDVVSNIGKGELQLHGERYRVLVVPPAEAMPHTTLAKVKAFHDAGGVVIGYGRLPSKSLTPERTGKDMLSLCDSIWGANAKPGPGICKTNPNGGRSYYLTEKPSPLEISNCMKDAGVPPIVEVMAGDTGNWLHVLRRVDREGRDIVMIANQNTDGGARAFSLLIPGAKGAPEAWDAMRGEFNSLPWRQEKAGVVIKVTLEPVESVLIRFGGNNNLPLRLTPSSQALATQAIEVATSVTPLVYQTPEKGQKSPCPGVAFQGEVNISADSLKSGQRAYLVCQMSADAGEDAAAVRVNGEYAGGFIGKPYHLEISTRLKAGSNTVIIEPFPVSKVWLEWH